MRSTTRWRLPDIDILLDRLTTARTRGERVLVFGDFDADGLTGLAILVLALRRFGLEVEPYVPSRLEEGHGLSLAAIDAAAAAGATVIVTVDCGTTSHAEIAAAGTRGIDVIVTDHHRVPPELPPALAVVNPHRPDATYPDRRLAGSGVAFKVAQALLADEPGGPAAALALTDLATIGSVADVAPMVGENRAIARLGLERHAHGAAARDRGPARTLADRSGRRRPRDRRVRPGAAAQRGRPGGGRLGGGTPAARRDRRGRGPARRRPRGREPRTARPDEAQRRGSAGRDRRDGDAVGDRRQGAVERRDRRARRRAPGRGPGPAGGRRCRARRRGPRLVPQRRLARPGRHARALRRPLHALRRARRRGRLRAAGRPLGRVPCPLPGAGRRHRAARPAGHAPGRSHDAGPRCRLRPAARAARARPDRPRQPGPAASPSSGSP